MSCDLLLLGTTAPRIFKPPQPVAVLVLLTPFELQKELQTVWIWLVGHFESCTQKEKKKKHTQAPGIIIVVVPISKHLPNITYFSVTNFNMFAYLQKYNSHSYFKGNYIRCRTLP